MYTHKQTYTHTYIHKCSTRTITRLDFPKMKLDDEDNDDADDGYDCDGNNDDTDELSNGL